MVVSASSSQAADRYSLNIKSPFDQFTVAVSNNSAVIQSKKVSMKPLELIDPLFQTELIEECPKLDNNKSDFLVKRVIKGKSSILRSIYLDKQLITDGKNCGTVDGAGLSYLPFHRSWFYDNESFKISFKKQVDVLLPPSVKISLKESKGEWLSQNDALILNWEYFDLLRQSFEQIAISGRLHPFLVKEKEPVTLNIDGQTYLFYSIAPSLWAVQLPSQPYLISSNQFQVFENMTFDSWQDRNGQLILIFQDPKRSEEERLQALDDISSHWSRSLKRALQSLLVADEDRREVKLQAIQHLRRHPSDETVLIAAQALSKTSHPLVQNRLIEILKTRNRKGPDIDPDKSSSKDSETIKYWQKWIKTFKAKI